MDIDTVERLISSLGFPIVVAGYLLIRFDGLLRSLKSSVDELLEEMKRHRTR